MIKRTNTLYPELLAVGVSLYMGLSSPAQAQVPALSVESYNATTREVTLTNSRGIATFPVNWASDATPGGGFDANAWLVIENQDIDTQGQTIGPLTCPASPCLQRLDANNAFELSGSDGNGELVTVIAAPSLFLLQGNASAMNGALTAGNGVLYLGFGGGSVPEGFNFNLPIAAASPASEAGLNIPTVNPFFWYDSQFAELDPFGNIISTRYSRPNVRPNGIPTRLVPNSPGLYQ